MNRRAGTSFESANLDLLRSAAVSFVVLFHVLLFVRRALPPASASRGTWRELGHWGVLLFFVHTCLVLMQSLERIERRRSPGQSLFVEFIVRRCFRLLPLSFLTVISISLFRLPVGHLLHGQFFAVPTRPVDVIANLLLVQNLTDVESVEAPLWSLPFEMQMYLVLPLLFAFVRNQANARRAIALWVAAFVFGLVWQRHRIGEMPAYVPCFLAGVVAYKLPKRRWSGPFWLWPLALVSTTVLYLRVPSLTSSWICCLAVGLVVPLLAEMPDGFMRRLCHYIARYSYGVYLSHFILIWFAFVKLSVLPPPIRVVVFVVLLVVVPVALYHLVEAPMMRIGATVADQWKARSANLQWASGALVAAVLVLLVAGLRTAGRRTGVLGLAETGGEPAAVHLVGRFDTRDRTGPRFAWPSSAIVTSFVGTGLDVRLRDWGSNYFTVVVDGGRPAVLATMEGTHEYPLASDLPSGHHEVVLTKRTEALVGAVQYLGVTPHGGRLVATPPAKPVRRIEYIGDSIACGYGVLGADAVCPFSPDTEDETIAFTALAAAGAQSTVIAYSGKGMYRDFGGSIEEPMPVLFRRTLPDDPTSTWTFDAPEPDAVVVAVGTNDYALGDPGPPFERAYAAFLRELRGIYPAAQVICTLSPMLSDSNPDRVKRRTAAAAAIFHAVQDKQASGDRRVAYLAFDEQEPGAGYGCDGHPSAKTHRIMAEKLAEAFGELLGWEGAEPAASR